MQHSQDGATVVLMGWVCRCNKLFDQTSAKLCAVAQMKEFRETVSRIIIFLHHQIKSILVTSGHHVRVKHLTVEEVTRKRFHRVGSLPPEREV